MVDFAKMLQEKRAEDARRAAMTPEARQAEDARQAAADEARLGVIEDREIFAGRKMRTITATLVGEDRMLRDGSMAYGARNAQGPLQIVLPGTRGEKMACSAAQQALHWAYAVAEAKGGAPAVAVEAQGFFRSRGWTDREGKAHKTWDFVASSFAFTHEGKTQTAGRAVAPDVLVDPVQPARAAAPKARDAGGDAR